MGVGLSSVRHSRGYRVLVRIGLIGYGLIHLVIASIAVQVAFGGSGRPSSRGALEQLSSRPLGELLVW